MQTVVPIISQDFSKEDGRCQPVIHVFERKHVGVYVSLHTVGVSVEKKDVRERVFTFCPVLLSHGTDFR